MLTTTAIGNLGQDAIIKNVNGKNVIEFSIAHSERYKDAQGNKHERTTWVNCSYWADKTAVAQYLKKGTKVYLSGTPSVQGYLSKQNQVQASFNLRVDRIELLDSKKDDSANSAPSMTGKEVRQEADMQLATEVPDDLPF